MINLHQTILIFAFTPIHILPACCLGTYVQLLVAQPPISIPPLPCLK
jgi:hypothetical protein